MMSSTFVGMVISFPSSAGSARGKTAFRRPSSPGARHRSGREGSPNRSRDREGALLALPIDLTLPHGRGSDWSTPYARILSFGRHLRKAHLCVAHPLLRGLLIYFLFSYETVYLFGRGSAVMRGGAGSI